MKPHSGPSRALRRKTARELPDGARRSPVPAFIEPCFPKAGGVPERGDWLCEVKQDGYRVQAHRRAGTWVLYSRRGHDWSARFDSITQALQRIEADSAILDGEIVVPGENGIADFRMLQADVAARRIERLVYICFDILYLDGADLRGVRVEERKALLAQLVPEDNEHVRRGEHFRMDPAAVFSDTCKLGFEGIVCKQLGSRYRSGESDDWVKVKCKKSDTFPIIAFVEKLGANPRRIASLYLGHWQDGQLLYAGKAETGFKHEMLYELRERLNPYIRPASPLSVPVKKPKATWVEPVVQAEIEYSSVTAGNILRMPVFKGIRDDLGSQGVRDNLGRATPVRQKHPRRHALAVPRDNVLQLLPDAVVPSKDELVAYWRKVGTRALAHLGRRPLKLVRHVHGTTFYHKGNLPPLPASVHALKIRKREGGEGTRVWVDDIDGLLGLVEIGAVELHPWNATVDDIERADAMVFDLDPGEGVEYDFVIATALALRSILQREGARPWPKLSGGKGIHVVVPLETSITHDAAHQRAKNIARRMASSNPKRYTTSAAMNLRGGRLFIDYLRNGRGTTAVGTYSPRARQGFPIAAPVTWAQVEDGVRPNAITLRHALRDELPRQRPAP